MLYYLTEGEGNRPLAQTEGSKNMAEMSMRTKRVYDSIVHYIQSAREDGYEKWLGKTKDNPVMRALYDEICSGVIYTQFDGRSLAALERRGLIRYCDDMERDCWRVVLVEE